MIDPAPAAFQDAADFERWLGEHHEQSDGAWLKIAKKGAAAETVSYAQAVEVALCFGWIDGKKQRLDDTYWLQRFTRRRARSRWSQINRTKAESLIAAGRMRPAGLAEVERARADGRWEDAYAGSATAEIPADLQRVFEAEPGLAEAFAALDSRNRYAIIWRLNDAKREATRAKRLSEYVGLLRAGGTLHP